MSWPGDSPLLALLSAFLFCLAVATSAVADDLSQINEAIAQLYQAGRHSEGVPRAEKSLELTRDRKGEEHLDSASAMRWLAAGYSETGDYAAADKLYLSAL